MGMDDAAETISQILSAIDRTPTPYESVRRALENALSHKNTLVGNQQPGSSTTRISLVPPYRAKLLDYIEVILHCKEASFLPI
jgi:S-adenosylmethionine:tRNA-ribosyltransferase-isomerase (queuine synthetase)